MLIAVLSGFVAALLAPWLTRIAGRAAPWIVAVVPIGVTGYFAFQSGMVASGVPRRETVDWVPSLGVRLSFTLDGLSLLFVLLISGIGALVVIYSGAYLKGHPLLGRFNAFILFFMGSMLGLVLADNVITLFAFWELTSLSSYLLIGFDHERPKAREAALQALLVTAGGGLALLAGLLLLAHAGGSYEISALIQQGEAVSSHPYYLAILLLILLGAFTKSAQFPFHFWLPGAMEAPSPVSAYLHSATMVTAGVYLLFRLSAVLGGTEEWYYIVVGTGAVTLLLGAALALVQTDLKRILAYSTVSALGMLVLLIGLDTSLAIEAALVFLVVHSLYKAALFLVAGAVDHATGTRDILGLGGLRDAMPITAAAAALSALSMAGLPPMIGFIAKELVYDAKLQSMRGAVWITSAGILANMITVAVAAIVGLRPFLLERLHTPKAPHEPAPSLWLGPLLLGVLGALIGVFPADFSRLFMSPSVSAVRGHPATVELSLWHGVSPVLLLSALTLLGGVAIYVARNPIRAIAARFDLGPRWGPARWYARGFGVLMRFAEQQTRFFQTGYLRHYVLGIVATAVALAGFTLFSRDQFVTAHDTSPLRIYELAIAALIVVAAFAAVASNSRLRAIAALGIVGYGVALVYAFFGAPDLAMTQILVETLTVVLFVLVLYHLPGLPPRSGRVTRVRDAVLALAGGALITTLVIAAAGTQFHPVISDYFNQNSVAKGHGRNIVNVILVDFRAFDTLGEITVLATAGVGILALLALRLRRDDREKGG